MTQEFCTVLTCISSPPVHRPHPTCRVALPLWPSSKCWDRLPHTNLREAVSHGAGDATQGRRSWRGRWDNTWGKGQYVLYSTCPNVYGQLNITPISDCWIRVSTRSQRSSSSVDHNIWIFRLEHCVGLKDTALEWFKARLLDCLKG